MFLAHIMWPMTKSTSNYSTSLLLAATAECDPRTARKALETGIESVKGYAMRERLSRAFVTLGLNDKSKEGCK